MATPYFQLRFDSVPSTQDVARDHFDDLPLLVFAAGQTKGRGRSGSDWRNADRSLAVSLIFEHEPSDHRPFSLMAGVAAVRATDGTRLKWPNDVLTGDNLKVGGILVERDESTTVVGLGLNLWWPEPPEGTGALYESDPGPDRHAEIGALWGAELMDLVESDGWPLDEYRQSCVTLGREIVWEPDGRGRAIDVARDGALVVDVGGSEARLVSGAVRHVRVSDN
ncbi:MAG TPA: biotin--[acetyl-CoA-carboxylase] ligase [Acidimicrobiia bacterium]